MLAPRYGYLSHEVTPHRVAPDPPAVLAERDAAAGLLLPVLELDLGAVWPGRRGRAVFFYAETEGNWAEYVELGVGPGGRCAFVRSLVALEPLGAERSVGGAGRYLEVTAERRRYEAPAVVLGGAPQWAQGGWADAFEGEAFVGELFGRAFSLPSYSIYLFASGDPPRSFCQVMQST
jgi:hypothetical protein